MEVVGRSGRLEGDLILPLDHWGFGVPRDGKYYPTPDRPVHTSPHTDTHMHGGNKYFPYQSAPSLIPQVGSLQRGGVKCSVFQGFQERAAGERKGQTLSPFAGWRFILGGSCLEELGEISCFAIGPSHPFTDGGQT